MSNSKWKDFLNDDFCTITSIISLIMGFLYIWKGLKSQFLIWGWFIIILSFLYVPFCIIWHRKTFPVYYLIYSGFLIFATAFDKTYLYNNYTPLFIICIVYMIQPKFRNGAILFYLILVSVAFILNEESLCHFFIHIVRSFWFIGIIDFVLTDKFRRKKLVLYEDEKRILDQLCEGKVYQKEVEGFSENTIYRKLKAARERNGLETRDQLVELYRAEKGMESE